MREGKTGIGLERVTREARRPSASTKGSADGIPREKMGRNFSPASRAACPSATSSNSPTCSCSAAAKNLNCEHLKPRPRPRPSMSPTPHSADASFRQLRQTCSPRPAAARLLFFSASSYTSLQRRWHESPHPHTAFLN